MNQSDMERHKDKTQIRHRQTDSNPTQDRENGSAQFWTQLKVLPCAHPSAKQTLTLFRSRAQEAVLLAWHFCDSRFQWGRGSGGQGGGNLPENTGGDDSGSGDKEGGDSGS